MLGMRIARLRKAAGWNQAELARRLQISPSAVGMYEQGRREPSAQMLVDMAQAFGVTVDYLLRGTLPEEETDLQTVLAQRVAGADRQLQRRKDRPFSRQELAVLFAAMLME